MARPPLFVFSGTTFVFYFFARPFWYDKKVGIWSKSLSRENRGVFAQKVITLSVPKNLSGSIWSTPSLATLISGLKVMKFTNWPGNVWVE